VINPWKEVYAKNYPMNDAAIYFGWSTRIPLIPTKIDRGIIQKLSHE
jgi:hypothetical protein